EQHYRNDVTVYVPDASRSVSVVSTLLNPDSKPAYVAGIRAEYEAVRKRSGHNRKSRDLLSFSDANNDRLKFDWKGYEAPRPEFLGVRVLDDYPLTELLP